MRYTAVMHRPLLLAGLVMLLVPGCVEQTLEISTDPPGALVYLNDQEFGRTPLKRDFVWYGNYDVQVRKEGYQTLSTHQWLYAPWWNWVPMDLIMNLGPLTAHDLQHMHFTLTPQPAVSQSPEALIAHAEALRGDLQSSQYTRSPMPTTMPTTTPTR